MDLSGAGRARWVLSGQAGASRFTLGMGKGFKEMSEGLRFFEWDGRDRPKAKTPGLNRL